jgi:type IV pilus assembly protein PilA
MLKIFGKRWYRPIKGFTLLEVLVVVAILGVIAAIVMPNIVRYVNAGEDESYLTEMDNIQTAVTAMLKESNTQQLESAPTDEDSATNDLYTVTTTGKNDSGNDITLRLSYYLYNLDTRESGHAYTKTGCEYYFRLSDGAVYQVRTE